MSRILLITYLLTLLIPLSGCQKSPEDARRELRQLGIRWSQEAFLESVENSDTVVVKLFLLAGMNPNATNAYGWTPLMHAAHSGHTEVVKTLLNAGAHVDAKDDDGFTPLSLAAGGGRTDTVRVLISAGADVNAKDSDGVTPLMYASAMGYTNIVQALLDNRVDVNVQSNGGDTALALAESQGQTEIAEILRLSGAVSREESFRASAEPLHANLVPKAAMGQLQMGLKG